MIENSRTVTVDLESLEGGRVDEPWMARDSRAEPTSVRGKRILVVDDEDPIRACLRMMLELDGHRITEAGNGAEALALFTADEFDLVITDFQMPVVEGNELAVHLKRLAPLLPILMITASARACREADNPVDALLTKPFTMSDLRGSILKLLSSRPEPAQQRFDPTPESDTAAFVPEAQLVTG